MPPPCDGDHNMAPLLPGSCGGASFHAHRCRASATSRGPPPVGAPSSSTTKPARGILLLPPRSRRFQPPLPLETLASPSLPPMVSSAGGAAGQIPSERRASTMVGNWVLALIPVHHFCEGRGASHGAATGRWQRPEERRWGNRPKSIHLQLPPSTNVARFPFSLFVFVLQFWMTFSFVQFGPFFLSLIQTWTDSTSLPHVLDFCCNA